MTYMIARDVWVGDDDDYGCIAANKDDTVTGYPTPAGLDAGGRERVMEKSLRLLRRARYLRRTRGGKEMLTPPASAFSSRVAHDCAVAPANSTHRDPFVETGKGVEGDNGQGTVRRDGLSEDNGDSKRRKVSSNAFVVAEGIEGISVTVGRDAVDSERRGRAEQEEEHNGGRGVVESEDDVLPWQVSFVMGRLCSRLGRHPRMVLDNLSQALRLAKVREARTRRRLRTVYETTDTVFLYIIAEQGNTGTFGHPSYPLNVL